MSNDSNDCLIAVLEPVRELLRYLEQRNYIEKRWRICEQVLEVRLSVDREIEDLRQFRFR